VICKPKAGALATPYRLP